MKWTNLCLALCLAAYASAAPLDQDYGYVDVRTGAHMFWVTYHTEFSNDWTQAPLIMWLQGGPGSSGVGYGNFMELGPFDINGNKRATAWTTKGNVMFVDNPVGTGYSYVDDINLLCSDNACIAADLLTMLKSVFNDYPEMQSMEFFIYCESYGGKMNAEFAQLLSQAISNGEINCNFKGIAMGDSWISPMDSINTWGDFLYHMGMVNEQGEAVIDASALKTQNAVDAGDWTLATVRWSETETVVEQQTNGVNFYNVLATENIYDSDLVAAKKHKRFPFMKPHIQKLYDIHIPAPYDELERFMNGDQKAAWEIPDEVVYDSQGGYVFNHLADDFMKPVTDIVEDLLTNSNIHVAVYTGDLDLICDTPGTYRWIANMNYPQKTDFEATDRQPLYINSYSSVAAYVQRSGRFSVFTLLRSGHMAPVDAGEMCLEMIDMITGYGEEAVPKQQKKALKTHKAKETPSVVVEKKKTYRGAKPVKVEIPSMVVKHQKPSERLVQHLKNPSPVQETERQLKAKIANVRVNNATPIGRKFDRGTIFNPKKPDLNI